ncbi:MAG: hypothetical protein QOG67_1916 [Verrucomicrobiota bacterium]|jgi:predicted O-methyltransferase YrrM
MNKLQRIIDDRPDFHRNETEISRHFSPAESLLPPETAAQLASEGRTCYGIESEVLRFIADTVSQGDRTLETGAGCSTMVFAVCGATHTAVTPAQSEIDLIKQYATRHEISLQSVHFVPESSETYLPRCDKGELDLVLLDGKHAFPWPTLDWFYTADRLRRGGLMIIDDASLPSVGLLADFMKADPAWDLVRDFEGKTLAFRKTRDSVHDVAWHMQPFTVRRSGNSERQNFGRRIARRIKRALKQ